MNPPSLRDIVSATQSRDMRVFRAGPGDLNLGGIRTHDMAANTFNDWLFAYSFVAGEPIGLVAPGTTDPGLYWRHEPSDPRGVAVLLPGQYRGFYGIGKHQGRYEALKQRREGRYWPAQPGANWDDLYVMMAGEMDADSPYITETTEIIGSNMHRANKTRLSVQVDKWSAACQVLAFWVHFDMVMRMARGQRDPDLGQAYTYSLLLEAWF